ncbi:GIY-YIG nuclease family protein [Vibrio palustris]|uniref:GIY-YIG nuclease superfamily protein n=1 Tax=Vibrio palustris TaxID=1918946 RepID=A0A1R4B6X2_9VIBR|nr:GIY-YIG nuclease family protein [Vibrio palustris]SJL84673.1 GIY-YIG nuclease superfamily protein [Vibrio palustris]
MTEATCQWWWVYLIRTRHNALYCGITTDVTRRFAQHQVGQGAKALKGKGPLHLVWMQKVATSRSEAQKIEYRIKQLSKKQKERLIGREYQLDTLFNVD